MGLDSYDPNAYEDEGGTGRKISGTALGILAKILPIIGPNMAGVSSLMDAGANKIKKRKKLMPNTNAASTAAMGLLNNPLNVAPQQSPMMPPNPMMQQQQQIPDEDLMG